MPLSSFLADMEAMGPDVHQAYRYDPRTKQVHLLTDDGRPIEMVSAAPVEEARPPTTAERNIAKAFAS